MYKYTKLTWAVQGEEWRLQVMKTFGAAQTSNLKARRAGLHGGLGRERQEKEKGGRRTIPYWDRTFPPKT